MSDLPQHLSLLKRENGRYYILYWLNGRRRWKSTGATTKPQAMEAVRQFTELIQKRQTTIPLEHFAEQFLSVNQNQLSPGTLERFKPIFEKFSAFVRGAYLAEITPETVEKYKAKRLAEVSAVTVNIEMRMLKAAFNTARRWKLIGQNPFEGVPFARIPEQEPLSLTRQDFEKLLACIRESWFKELVIFAVTTGMRRGEIINLRWQDVNLQQKTISIQTNERFRTKHGRRRTIPLNETAFLILTSRHGKSPSEFVFTLDDLQIKKGRLTQGFKRYVRAAKLSNPRLRFHSLRHSTATWLVQLGVPLAHVQRLLGHSSVTTTEGYSHHSAEDLHSAVNRIDISLG